MASAKMKFKTVVSHFKRWWTLIKGYEPYLIPIQREGKAPSCNGSWKDEENRINYEQSVWNLENGYNVAYSPRGELAVMDIDNLKEAQKHISDETLNETLAVETRSGKLHLYFENDIDFENKDITENGGEVLELRTKWRYLLVPGSYVPSEKSDGLYKVVNPKKPDKLSKHLPEALEGDEDYDYNNEDVDFDGEWLSLPCVKTIYKSENLPESGRRRKGGKVLSMAWYLDGRDKRKFNEWIKPFVERNRHGHDHRPNHYNWIPTIERKGLEWNCAEIRSWLEKTETAPCGRCPMFEKTGRKTVSGDSYEVKEPWYLSWRTVKKEECGVEIKENINVLYVPNSAEYEKSPSLWFDDITVPFWELNSKSWKNFKKRCLRYSEAVDGVIDIEEEDLDKLCKKVSS